MSDVVTPEAVYEWRAPVDGALVTKERITVAALLGGGAAMAAWGVISAVIGAGADVRFLVVVGVMLLSLGAWAVRDSRRLRSTVIRIDRMGTLTVSDTKQQATIDLRTVSTLSVRRRSGRPQWHWSIEAAHPGGAWHAELAGLATYWNLGDDEMAKLESELLGWLAWATGNAAVARAPGAASASPSASFAAGSITDAGSSRPPAAAIAVRGVVTSTPREFEWEPPEHPNKARNRRRLRIGVVGFAVLVALFAAISEAENGVTAVLFSMFVPVLILLIGFGVDRAYDLGRRFRIGVDANGLSIRRSSKPPIVVAAPTIATLQISLAHESTHDANIEASNWYLTVGTNDGETKRIPIPLSLGSSFARNDAIALEAELRRRLGVEP